MRYIVPGCTYHVTHRCHNRAFLLKFKRDRTTYRQMLRDRLRGRRISILSYCITSNHVHLLLRLDPSDGLESLSEFMQSLEGDFSQNYNRRKGRQNAFWGDRYHATMVDSGAYLWRCLRYIDLNMVRAGAVVHPREWEWTAYQELMGLRRRYRVVDMAALLEQLHIDSEQAFRATYGPSIEEALEQEAMAREARWTESLAVGGEEFVKKVGRSIRNRMKVETTPDEVDETTWILREASPADAYG